LRPNGRALSRAALKNEKTLTLKPAAKIALILLAACGVGYSAVLGGTFDVFLIGTHESVLTLS
jgi:hypothetical protein